MPKFIGSFVCSKESDLRNPVSGEIIDVLYCENGLRKVFDDSFILEKIDLLELVVKDNLGRVASIYLSKSKLKTPFSFRGKQVKIYADIFLYAIEF